MKETGLRSRTCVVPVVVAAGLGMAGAMGLVSDGIVAADVTSVTDTLSITVLETCTFRDVSDLTFTGSALSGSEVENFSHSGVHEFNVFCNSSNGYTVSATPYDLEAVSDDITDVIAYTDDYTPSGRNGLWTAEITSTTPGITVTNPVPVGGGVIVSSGTNTLAAGTTFTATYSAYVGSVTPAGTYVGRIDYFLSSLSGGNGGGGSNHQDSGNDNTGNEETGDTEDDNGSGSGGQTGGQTGGGETGGQTSGGSETGGQTGGSGTDNSQNSINPVNTNSNPSNSLNAAPAMTTLSNSYSTNNVNNTYNTYNMNYSGGGSMPSTTGGTTPVATTSGDDNEDSTNPTANNENNLSTSSSYEKPLGVTSTTKSTYSTESDSMDPMPIVAAGAVTAAAVAGVALMRSGKKEEDK